MHNKPLHALNHSIGASAHPKPWAMTGLSFVYSSDKHAYIHVGYYIYHITFTSSSHTLLSGWAGFTKLYLTSFSLATIIHPPLHSVAIMTRISISIFKSVSISILIDLSIFQSFAEPSPDRMCIAWI
jgi:hypothetical protein